MKRLSSLLLGLGVLAVTAVTLIPLSWPIIPRATILAPMAPQAAALTALLAAWALVARRRKLALLGLLVAAWNAQLIWPDISPFRPTPGMAAGERVLKVVNFNIRFKNQRLDAAADYLVASGADVIGLVEANARSKAAFLRLKAVYPYSIDCIAADSKCQNMLFSKYPLSNAYAGPIDGRYPFVAMADVLLPDGTSIRIAAAHVMTPFTRKREPLAAVDPGPAPSFPDAPDLEQSYQAANLAAFLKRQPADLVLVGDFNSASWSPLQRAFRAASGLDNRGHFLPTWPTSVWPILRLPLDPVFVRGRARIVELRLGPEVGSDHFPVEAEIAIRPE